MKIDDSKGFGKTRVEWTIDGPDETAIELHHEIRDAIQSIRDGDDEE